MNVKNSLEWMQYSINFYNNLFLSYCLAGKQRELNSIPERELMEAKYPELVENNINLYM
jgi:hypothetical protein